MNGKLILLVDDELYVTAVVSQQLRRRGFEVIMASDGPEALALVQDRRPDLIVSDFQMVPMSGLEMAVQLRQNPATSTIPIILLTAREHLLNSSELTNTNIRCILSKPFSIKEVVGKIEHLLAIQSGDNLSPPLRESA
jgi:CheY-like chemotaxis protein